MVAKKEVKRGREENPHLDETKRPPRRSLSGTEILKAVPRKGYHSTFVYEEDVPKYLAAYYELVDDPSRVIGAMTIDNDSTRLNRYSCAVDLGKGMVGYLMDLPEKYWQEDIKARREENNRLLKTIDPDHMENGLKGHMRIRDHKIAR